MESIIKKMTSDVYLASLNIGKDKIVMCNATGTGSKPPDQKDIDMTNIMIKQLEARLAKLKGDESGYLSLLKEAVAIEDKITHVFGPPAVFKPVHEEYAEALAKNRQPQEAMEAYEACLAKHPRRLKSLQGKLILASALGDPELAESVLADIGKSKSVQERKEIL